MISSYGQHYNSDNVVVTTWMSGKTGVYGYTNVRGKWCCHDLESLQLEQERKEMVF